MSVKSLYCIIISTVLIIAGSAQAEGDPTRPGRSYQDSAVLQEKAGLRYQVSAIFITGNRPQAIVNNRLVSEGDQVADAVVKRITKDAVVLTQRYAGASQSISLFVNKPVTNKFSIRAADKY